MNTAHWHLIVVHIPIVLVPLAAVLLSLGLLRNQEALKRTSFAILSICGMTTAAAFLTGDGAEEVVERLAGISETLIEAHEEAADVALWLCSISGIISAFLLLPGSRSLAKKLTFVAVMVSWGASASLAYTGYLGGMIRHPEAYAASQVQAESAQDDD